MTADLTLFDHRVRVFGAPSRYIQGSGAIAWLGPAIKQLGTRALVVSDALVRDLLQEKIIHGLLAHEIDVQFLEFFRRPFGTHSGGDRVRDSSRS